MQQPPDDAGATQSAALAGRTIAVPEARQLDVLAGLLERRGGAVLRCPLVGIRDPADPLPVIAWIERRIAVRTDLVVLYTGEGVERLVAAARRAALEAPFIAALRRTALLTRGPKPKRALRRFDLAPRFEAAPPTTDGLIATLKTIDLPGRVVGIQLYDRDQDGTLVDYFRGRGIEPDCVAPYAYASASEDERAVELIFALESGRVDAIAFTSKAQFARLQRLARSRGLERALATGLERARVAAVGPVVAADLAAAGVRVDAVPDGNYSMKPLVTALCELLHRA